MHAKDRNVATRGSAWNRFEYFSLHAYVLRFPKLKCPTAVSAAEISAAAVIMKRHAQDRPNVPAHILRRS